MYVAGLDLGSSTAKAVVANEDGIFLTGCLIPSGGNFRLAAEKVLGQAAGNLGIGLGDFSLIVATGLGAKSTPFPCRQVTEISCQGRGINSIFPSARTVIDVGGQATKVIRVDEKGRSEDFMISEKCAAGSGRFLQVIARVLQISIDEIGTLSLKAAQPVDFTTNCAVFMESEVVSRVAEGAGVENILAGVHIAMASKVENLVRRVGLAPDCAIAGGGARDMGLVRAVAEKLGAALLVPEDPGLTCALGASALAAELLREKQI